MKRFIVPLIAGLTAGILAVSSCAQPAPAPAPAPAPSPAPAPAPSSDPLNPFGTDFAVKPDGTPYKFAHTLPFMGNEFCVVGVGLMESLVKRAGGEFINNDPNLDIQKQMAFVEDIAATKGADVIMARPLDMNALAPGVELAIDSGIPFIAWDMTVITDRFVPLVYHDFDGPAGANVLGEYLVEVADKTGEQINVLELWGNRGEQTMVDRHNGFLKGIAEHPLITVMESPDTHYSAEEMANATMDAFTAHPELNAIFGQASCAGVIDALEGIGRLKPVGDPDHVIGVFIDNETQTIDAIYDGFIDGVSSHGPRDMIDVVTQVAFLYIVVGQPVPEEIVIPMVIITPENISTVEVMGDLADWTALPYQQYDKWKVLDITQIGLPTPTKTLRMQQMGY